MHYTRKKSNKTHISSVNKLSDIVRNLDRCIVIALA